METTLHTDCGDGRRRADVGSAFNGTAPVAKTANYSIVPTDVGTCFTNKAAGGTVQFKLPAPKFGMWFMFIVTAAQTLEVLPNGSEKINNGSTKISAAGSQAGVGVAYVVFDGTQWSTLLSGTWTTS
ncbi:MAG TPA: hypothetical protein VNL17_14480 [Verrucomicrobiae bacterium]|nr:hypothetical protein [Verrucomicrobiae bacterium]